MFCSLVEAALLGPPSTLPANGVVAIRHESSDTCTRPLIGMSDADSGMSERGQRHEGA
jgi:hypothetical protein